VIAKGSLVYNVTLFLSICMIFLHFACNSLRYCSSSDNNPTYADWNNYLPKEMLRSRLGRRKMLSMEVWQWCSQKFCSGGACRVARRGGWGG